MKNSPYLDRPLLPLAVALPRMLAEIEAELADVKVSAVEKWRLRQRAEFPGAVGRHGTKPRSGLETVPCSLAQRSLRTRRGTRAFASRGARSIATAAYLRL
jgi:hypothetical protein